MDTIGIVETQFFTFAVDEPFALDSGAALSPVNLWAVIDAWLTTCWSPWWSDSVTAPWIARRR